MSEETPNDRWTIYVCDECGFLAPSPEAWGHRRERPELRKVEVIDRAALINLRQELRQERAASYPGARAEGLDYAIGCLNDVLGDLCSNCGCPRDTPGEMTSIGKPPGSWTRDMTTASGPYTWVCADPFHVGF